MGLLKTWMIIFNWFICSDDQRSDETLASFGSHPHLAQISVLLCHRVRRMKAEGWKDYKVYTVEFVCWV